MNVLKKDTDVHYCIFFDFVVFLCLFCLLFCFCFGAFFVCWVNTLFQFFSVLKTYFVHWVEEIKTETLKNIVCIKMPCWFHILFFFFCFFHFFSFFLRFYSFSSSCCCSKKAGSFPCVHSVMCCNRSGMIVDKSLLLSAQKTTTYKICFLYSVFCCCCENEEAVVVFSCAPCLMCCSMQHER